MLALFAVLGPAWALGLRIGTRSHGAASLSVNSSESAVDVFKCPSECRECGPASWFKTSWGGFGVSRDRFKCILQRSPRRLSKDDFPIGRTCSEPLQRSDTSLGAKTDCDFTDDEKRTSPQDSLDQCSKKHLCCCTKKQELSETICQPKNQTNMLVHIVSPLSGHTELYRKQPDSYLNKADSCKIAGHEPKGYDTSKTGGWSNRGCCLRTMWYAKIDRFSNNYETGPDSAGYCTSPAFGGHEWTGGMWRALHMCHVVCVEWERVYHCSEDGGATQSGNRYKRAPEGHCLGDQTSMDRLVHVYGKANVDRMWAERPNLAFDVQLMTKSDGENPECPEGYSEHVNGERCECDEFCSGV